MKTLKTRTHSTIKISSNKRDRTYTIRTEAAIYRTIPFDEYEFNSARKWTGDDWNNFLLNQNDEYYRVKLL